MISIEDIRGILVIIAIFVLYYKLFIKTFDFHKQYLYLRKYSFLYLGGYIWSSIFLIAMIYLWGTTLDNIWSVLFLPVLFGQYIIIWGEAFLHKYLNQTDEYNKALHSLKIMTVCWIYCLIPLFIWIYAFYLD
jgi:hypothetical protein